jgi:hypothetical protein
MTIGRQKLSEYDKRIERAKYLAAEYSFAAKPLKFYEQITQFQQGLFATLVKEWGEATRAKAAGRGGNRHSAGRVGCVGRVADQLLAGWWQSGRKRNVALG